MNIERIPNALVEIDKDLWVNPAHIRSVYNDPSIVGEGSERVIVEWSDGSGRILSREVALEEVIDRLNPDPLILKTLSGDGLG